MQSSEIFDTQSKAAEIISHSERTLERWRFTGEGPPFIKLGRRVLYRRSDLLSWLTDRTVKSTAEAQRVGR